MKEKIKEILLNEFIEVEDSSELEFNTELITSGLLDSISILQLVDILESEFEITFQAHELDKTKFESIDLISEMVASKKT